MRYLVVLLCSLLACALVVIAPGFADVGASGEPWQTSCQGLFKQDFSTYWLWVTYWTHGHNPYDTDQLRVYAQSLNCTLTGAHYVPPFIVPLLVPIMVWPLTVAALLWACLNSAMVWHIFRIMLRECPPRARARGPLGVALLLFSPATAACLAYGQFGILCAWAMVVASRSALRPVSTLPGVLALAALKPHLGFIYWLGFLGHLLRSRKIGVCLATGGVMVLSTAVVEALTPGALASWLHGAGGALRWMGASPITFIRLAFQTSDSAPPLWPVVVGPLVAIGYAIGCLVREGRWFDRERDLPLFTALSLCATPYLWCLDFAVLLIAELSVLGRWRSAASSCARLSLSAGLIMLARIALAVQMMLGVSGYQTGWYPLAILCALLVLRGEASPTPDTDR